jgi:quercetin dioxygenase-like cupin family protein
MMKKVLNMGLAMVVGVATFSTLASAQEIENYVPNSISPEPRVLGMNTTNMKEVVPGQLYMKHMVGPDVSVVVLNIKRGESVKMGRDVQQNYKGDEATRAASISAGKMPPVHVHGQEIAIVLKGYGKVVTEDGKEYPIKEGEAIIMPAGLPHTGTFDAPDNLVMSITTPRRPEYGAHDQAKY